MATKCRRRVIRETSEIHGPTQRPFILKINEGGKTVSIKIKGRRTWFTVTVKQIWTTGAWNAAAVIRAERKRKREERKREARERNKPLTEQERG